MPVDRWGIPFFYPTKPGGFEYEMSDDPANDSNFEDGDNATYGNDDEFQVDITDSNSVHITCKPGFIETSEGCNEDFADNEARGYADDSNDIRDIEMKMLLSIENGNVDNGLSLSGPTGRHASNSSPCCGGNAYMLNIQYAEDPTEFRFRKEMWHVSYHTDPINGQWTHPDVPFSINDHGYVGVGYVRYNNPNGMAPGRDSVIIEAWFNPDPEANIGNWIMLKRIEDKGIGWGDDGAECGGDDDQVLNWGGVKFRIKGDDTATVMIKHLSLREIDPFADFDDEDPDPPQQITTIQGAFKTQWDVNNLRVSPCAGVGGGGGGGGTADFYSVPETFDRELSDSVTFGNRIASGEYAINSSSVMVGKIIKQFDARLKKVGTPAASPTIKCQIRNSANTLLYESTTAIDPTTLTTSYATYTFDMTTNTHVMVSGDRLQIFYNGTSDVNYVAVGQATNDPVPNSANFSIRSTGFQENPNTELAGTMWQ